jgi:hypothetical protein
LALLILLRECEIFDFGTANKIGGRSSSNDAKPGMDRYHGAERADDAIVGDERVKRGSADRKIDDSCGRKGRVTRDELATRDKAVILDWNCWDWMRMSGQRRSA